MPLTEDFIYIHTLSIGKNFRTIVAMVACCLLVFGCVFSNGNQSMRNQDEVILFKCGFHTLYTLLHLCYSRLMCNQGRPWTNWSKWDPHILSAIQVHTTTCCMFYREQLLDPAPPKADVVCNHLYNMDDNSDFYS